MSEHPQVIPAEGGLCDPWVDLRTGYKTFVPLFPKPKGRMLTNAEAGVMLSWVQRLRGMIPKETA
jgi:hypothetical protein